eukprot:3050861-Pyramimonas_sp.AAC.1
MAWVKFHGRWASEGSLAHYIRKPLLPQPYLISNLRLPTRWIASGRSSAAWMSALPATKPSAARLRLSASSLLEAASRVEVTAGKIAFGEQIGTVYDQKHDYAKQ